jgi:acetyl-CoA carboxylase biotin carboxyl carrier protein
MMKTVNAEIAGNVWKILVGIGDQVKIGQEVVILESMKMEIPITVVDDGTITNVKVIEGDFVNEGELLIELED